MNAFNNKNIKKCNNSSYKEKNKYKDKNNYKKSKMKKE
jgi:hypothetical protein